jgi:molecular chaperone DnaK
MAEADKAKREEADLRNESNNLIFQTNKAVVDLGEEVTEEEKSNIEKLTKELEEALGNDDLDAIKKAKEALEKDAQSIAIKAYEKAQKEHEHTEGANGHTDSNNNDDNTVDAEFEEK